MLEVGKPLPVNVVSDSGQLLLRKGQPIISDQHRDKLHGFNASTTPADASAWQRAYERMVHEMLRSGMAVQDIAKLPMPAEIRETDYVVAQQLQGGWLDLQEVLRGILYQGGLAINPLLRLISIEQKALPMTACFACFRCWPMTAWVTARRTPCCALLCVSSPPANWDWTSCSAGHSVLLP